MLKAYFYDTVKDSLIEFAVIVCTKKVIHLNALAGTVKRARRLKKLPEENYGKKQEG